MTALITALLAEMSEEDIDALAQRLAPRISQALEADAGCSSKAWLGVAAAAEYLSCPPSRIYALVSARRIPFQKDGSRTLFDRAELDAWVRHGGAKRP